MPTTTDITPGWMKVYAGPLKMGDVVARPGEDLNGVLVLNDQSAPPSYSAFVFNPDKWSSTYQKAERILNWVHTVYGYKDIGVYRKIAMASPKGYALISPTSTDEMQNGDIICKPSLNPASATFSKHTLINDVDWEHGGLYVDPTTWSPDKKACHILESAKKWSNCQDLCYWRKVDSEAIKVGAKKAKSVLVPTPKWWPVKDLFGQIRSGDVICSSVYFCEKVYSEGIRDAADPDYESGQGVYVSLSYHGSETKCRDLLKACQNETSVPLKYFRLSHEEPRWTLNEHHSKPLPLP